MRPIEVASACNCTPLPPTLVASCRATMRKLLFFVCTSTIFLWFIPVLSVQSQQRSNKAARLDLLLVHGSVIDGSGSEPRSTDVGIQGDRIAFVGDSKKQGVAAARVI